MNNKLLILIATIIFVGCKETTTGTGGNKNDTNIDPPASWFTDRGGINHTASVNEDITLPLVEQWTVNLGGAIIGTPVGCRHGLLVPSGNKLMLINTSDGTVLWEYESPVAIYNTPTSFEYDKGEVSRVAFVDSAGDLVCLDASNGEEVWKIEIGHGTFNSSSNYASGLLYYSRQMPNNGTNLAAINGNDGSIVWEQDLGNITTTTPLHGFGKIYNGGCQQSINPYKAYNDRTGNIDLQLEYESLSNTPMCFTNGVIDYDVGVGNNAKIYIAHGGASQAQGVAQLKAIAVNSFSEVWSTQLSAKEVTGMALTQNRTNNTFIITQRDAIHSIDPADGSILWTVNHNTNSQHGFSKQFPQPLIWGNYAFTLSGNQSLKAYDLSNGNEVHTHNLQAQTYSSPIVGSSHLYIGDGSGNLTCFRKS